MNLLFNRWCSQISLGGNLDHFTEIVMMGLKVIDGGLELTDWGYINNLNVEYFYLKVISLILGQNQIFLA